MSPAVLTCKPKGLKGLRVLYVPEAQGSRSATVRTRVPYLPPAVSPQVAGLAVAFMATALAAGGGIGGGGPSPSSNPNPNPVPNPVPNPNPEPKPGPGPKPKPNPNQAGCSCQP
jgi:hypothetical protein